MITLAEIEQWSLKAKHSLRDEVNMYAMIAEARKNNQLEISKQALSEMIDDYSYKKYAQMENYYEINTDASVADILEQLDNWDSERRSYNGFMRHILSYCMPLEQKQKRMDSAVENLMTRVKTNLEGMKNGNSVSITELEYIKKILDRHLPEYVDMPSLEELRHDSCACCGSMDIPRDGFIMLKHTDYTKENTFSDNIYYPVCEECYKNGVPPNWEMVAAIYVRFSIQLLRAYDSLIDSINIDKPRYVDNIYEDVRLERYRVGV